MIVTSTKTLDPTTEQATTPKIFLNTERFTYKVEAQARVRELSDAGYDVSLYHGHRAWVVRSPLPVA